jgi:hypothetical protein
MSPELARLCLKVKCVAGVSGKEACAWTAHWAADATTMGELQARKSSHNTDADSASQKCDAGTMPRARWTWIALR